MLEIYLKTSLIDDSAPRVLRLSNAQPPLLSDAISIEDLYPFRAHSCRYLECVVLAYFDAKYTL